MSLASETRVTAFICRWGIAFFCGQGVTHNHTDDIFWLVFLTPYHLHSCQQWQSYPRFHQGTPKQRKVFKLLMQGWRSDRDHGRYWLYFGLFLFFFCSDKIISKYWGKCMIAWLQIYIFGSQEPLGMPSCVRPTDTTLDRTIIKR